MVLKNYKTKYQDEDLRSSGQTVRHRTGQNQLQEHTGVVHLKLALTV